MASSDDDSGSASAEEVSDEAPGTYALTDHSPAAMAFRAKGRSKLKAAGDLASGVTYAASDASKAAIAWRKARASATDSGFDADAKETRERLAREREEAKTARQAAAAKRPPAGKGAAGAANASAAGAANSSAAGAANAADDSDVELLFTGFVPHTRTVELHEKAVNYVRRHTASQRNAVQNQTECELH